MDRRAERARKRAESGAAAVAEPPLDADGQELTAQVTTWMTGRPWGCS